MEDEHEDRRVTAEHVREAARRLSPEYNYARGFQDGHKRAGDRAYWFFLPAMMWVFAIGWTVGAREDAWRIPWGSYAIAVIFTVLAYFIMRRKQ